MLIKMRSSCCRNSDDRVPVLARSHDEPTFACFLPDRKFRTRRAPRFDDLVISSLLTSDVLEEIEDQRIDGVSHKWTRFATTRVASQRLRYLAEAVLGQTTPWFGPDTGPRPLNTNFWSRFPSQVSVV